MVRLTSDPCCAFCRQTFNVFPLCSLNTDNVEAELLHTFTKVYKFDTLLLLVRLAVLTAVTLTVPIVLFPVSASYKTLCVVSKRAWIVMDNLSAYFAVVKYGSKICFLIA